MCGLRDRTGLAYSASGRKGECRSGVSERTAWEEEARERGEERPDGARPCSHRKHVVIDTVPLEGFEQRSEVI